MTDPKESPHTELMVTEVPHMFSSKTKLVNAVVLLLMTGSQTAYPVEFPVGIVQFSSWEGLAGSPKVVEEFSTLDTGARLVRSRTFDAYGRMIKDKEYIGGSLAVDARCKFQRERFVSCISERSDGSSGGDTTTTKAMKFDIKNRPTVVSEMTVSRRGLINEYSPTTLVEIVYGQERQVHTTYQSVNGVPIAQTRKTLQIAGNVITESVCWLGEDSGKACVYSDRYQYGNTAVRRFSSYGRISYDAADIKVVANYDGDLLVAEKRYSGVPEANVLASEILYLNYVIDGCGNWTSRRVEQIFPKGEGSYDETRVISYYKNCSE